MWTPGTVQLPDASGAGGDDLVLVGLVTTRHWISRTEYARNRQREHNICQIHGLG
jgi:hypothetical protein